MQNVSRRRRSSASVVAAARSRHSSTWLRSCSASPRSLSPSARSRDRVVAVVVGGAARREHERSRTRASRRRRGARACCVEVDVDDLALAVADVRRAAEHLAQRRGDLRRVQQAARDLVEQRREQVVVLPVDERDVDGLAPQRLRALQPAEAGADDHDTGMGTHAADCRMNASSTGLPMHAPARERALTWGCVASISRIEVGEASRRRRIVVKEPAQTNKCQ